MATPLKGIRVLDASTGIAGPMAAMYLADFGADVVKVEPPGGEAGRSNPGFAMWNRSKRGIVIDDAKASDRERLLELLRGADVCLFSEPLAALQRRGLDPETLRAANGRLVYLHMPAFTESAPWAGEQESAAMLEAATGIAREQYGFEDVPIDGIYPHVLYAQAMWGATTTAAALIERESSGAGQTVTVGGLHGVLLSMTGQVTHVPGAEHIAAVGGPGGPVPFYRLYEGNDAQWLFMATLTPAFFMAAFDQLDVLDILADERLGGDPMAMALPENGPWVIERVREAFKTRGRDAWRDALSAAGCPNGAVNDRDTWLDHPQIVATGMRAEIEDPERGTVVMPGLPVNLSDTPGAVGRPAPTLGQHDAEVGSWSAQAGSAQTGSGAGSEAEGSGPLTGLRVLDLGSIIAGTYAGSLMAELGADVIKVEAPAGDNLRAFGPTFAGYNKGKRSIAIDLRGETGRALFLDLVKSADMVVDNYRMGVLERLQIDYASLKEANPEIITISVTGYGEGGPLDTDPGFDPILQALSGMMQAQGGDSDPVFFTLPVNDISSACTAALGGLLAVLHRKRGGHGQRVWTSLAAQSCMMQSGELVRFDGREPSKRGGGGLCRTTGAGPLLPGPRRLGPAAGGARRGGAGERGLAAGHSGAAGQPLPAAGAGRGRGDIGDGAVGLDRGDARGGSGAGAERGRGAGDARTHTGGALDRPAVRGHGDGASFGAGGAAAGRCGVAVQRGAIREVQSHGAIRRDVPTGTGRAHARGPARGGPGRIGGGGVAGGRDGGGGRSVRHPANAVGPRSDLPRSVRVPQCGPSQAPAIVAHPQGAPRAWLFLD